ncbi:MAG: beta-ketoacyl-[Paludibacteraceae bacterium]|nr:beta-ketoacyl-[acyl-carrier-protein] synthase family protein [Paludibacteraceae bacterium]
MKRVVVTGMGIWSCIGQDLQSVTESLKQGRSGIIFDPQRIEYGLHSGLTGNVPRPNLKPLLPRKYRATMSEDAEYAYMAARQAFEQAGIEDTYLRQNEVGIIFGNDGNVHMIDHHAVMLQEHDSHMLGPSVFFQSVTSSVTMNLSTIFHLKGINMCVGAACASSSHAIGLAMMFIRQGLQDTILVGGSCTMDMRSMVTIDAIEVISLRNNEPTCASRPFDADRDGTIPSGGAAALVLEEYEHAVARGATILAEVCGYGFSSNGIDDISMPSAEAEYIAMQRAMADANLLPADIDYVNAHGTSTPVGDIEEAKALARLFRGTKQPFVSSTKSMTGHENWMAGASEAVYSLLMMQHNFVAPNINLQNKIDEAKNLNIVTDTVYTPIRTILSNSSGMGGTNSALVFKAISSQQSVISDQPKTEN